MNDYEVWWKSGYNSEPSTTTVTANSMKLDGTYGRSLSFYVDKRKEPIAIFNWSDVLMVLLR